MNERFRAFLARRREAREIAAMTDADLADLGLTRHQVQVLAAAARDLPDRLDRMAAVFGLSKQDLRLDHGIYAELLTNCATCAAAGTCDHAFATLPDMNPDKACFCPNGPEYRDMGARG